MPPQLQLCPTLLRHNAVDGRHVAACLVDAQPLPSPAAGVKWLNCLCHSVSRSAGLDTQSCTVEPQSLYCWPDRIVFEYDLIPQLPCAPNMVNCDRFGSDTWQYTSVGGTLLVLAAKMPQQANLWQRLRRLPLCNAGKAIIKTHTCRSVDVPLDRNCQVIR